MSEVSDKIELKVFLNLVVDSPIVVSNDKLIVP